MDFSPDMSVFLQCELKKVIEDMMNFVDIIDSNYQDMVNNNLMRYWQTKNVTLKSVLLTDLLDWLCCLAFSDGFIAPEEIQFINSHLKQNFSDNDIIELCKFRINEDYFKNVPLSFVLLYENDLIMKDFDSDFDSNSVELLFMLFMTIGVHFIYCDGNAAFKELAVLNGFTEDLYNRINDFNLIQKHLTVLEMSGGEFSETYSENRYPFSQDVFNDYAEELSDFEDINGEIINNNLSSDINVNPLDTKTNKIQDSRMESIEINNNSSWDLKINPNAYYNFTGEFTNHLDDFNDIFTQKNRQNLENIHLTPHQYRSILYKIKSTSDNLLEKNIDENDLDLNSLNIFEKILLFAKTFVDVDYKASGPELGTYSFNKIYLDDRLSTANQITTLIHELSHHLLAEIFEQAVMIYLNTDKTDAIESYVWFSLMTPPSVLLNEYCAHSVEGRFTPHGYQNYGSFENILETFDMGEHKELVDMCMKVGNTFCQDILTIMEPFIDYDLREEIKEQFKKDLTYRPYYNGIYREINETLCVDELSSFINFILLSSFDVALENQERLVDFKSEFELHNKNEETI